MLLSWLPIAAAIVNIAHSVGEIIRWFIVE